MIRPRGVLGARRQPGDVRGGRGSDVLDRRVTTPLRPVLCDAHRGSQRRPSGNRLHL